jgi:hypothetical protein
MRYLSSLDQSAFSSQLFHVAPPTVPIIPLALLAHVPGEVDVRLSGKGYSNSHGTRPVHSIISMVQWIRASSLSIKNPLRCQKGTLSLGLFELEIDPGSFGNRCSTVDMRPGFNQILEDREFFTPGWYHPVARIGASAHVCAKAANTW